MPAPNIIDTTPLDEQTTKVQQTIKVQPWKAAWPAKPLTGNEGYEVPDYGFKKHEFMAIAGG